LSKRSDADRYNYSGSKYHNLSYTFQIYHDSVVPVDNHKKMESKGFTAYTVMRMVFGLLDICSDVGLAVHLFLKQELMWGGLTLGWVGVGVLAALLGVTLGRCRTGDSMSCLKFSLLTLKLYVEVVQGFFLSGNTCRDDDCYLYFGVLLVEGCKVSIAPYGIEPDLLFS
jgi:hypothetical protein